MPHHEISFLLETKFAKLCTSSKKPHAKNDGKKRVPSSKETAWSNELTHQKKECAMECHGGILPDKNL
jgi:hypothetical protein